MGTTTSKLTKILASKADAKAAIIDKGVACDNEFDQYGNRIRQIKAAQTTTLIRPASITGPEGAGNYTENSVIGNAATPLSWSQSSLSTTGYDVYYGSNRIGRYSYPPSQLTDRSRNFWGRFRYDPDNDVAISAMGPSGLVNTIHFTFVPPSDFPVTLDTYIEVVILGCLGDDTHYYNGSIQYTYCRFTNEDIV